MPQPQRIPISIFSSISPRQPDPFGTLYIVFFGSRACDDGQIGDAREMAFRRTISSSITATKDAEQN